MTILVLEEEDEMTENKESEDRPKRSLEGQEVCLRQNSVFDRLLAKQNEQFQVQLIQQQQLSAKIMSELPKVNIAQMVSYPQSSRQVNYKMPPNYINYIELSQEDLDELVEYDMDEGKLR
jgi:hypothetical protein